MAICTAAATNWKPCFSKLGYEPVQLDGDDPVWGNRSFRHPEGRKAVFLGDLVDRGPTDSRYAPRLVRNMVAGGTALCVPGNHDMKLMRKLRGKDVQIKHGLAESVAEMEALPEEIRRCLRRKRRPNSSMD